MHPWESLTFLQSKMTRHIAIAVLLALAACQLDHASAATPIRAQWIKDPYQPQKRVEMPTQSLNPLRRWWTALHSHDSTTDSKAECIWLDYPKHDNLKAWEFQCQPRRHVVS